MLRRGEQYPSIPRVGWRWSWGGCGGGAGGGGGGGVETGENAAKKPPRIPLGTVGMARDISCFCSACRRWQWEDCCYKRWVPSPAVLHSREVPPPKPKKKTPAAAPAAAAAGIAAGDGPGALPAAAASEGRVVAAAGPGTLVRVGAPATQVGPPLDPIVDGDGMGVSAEDIPAPRL